MLAFEMLSGERMMRGAADCVEADIQDDPISEREESLRLVR